jgi:hypothetical protein
LPEVALKVHGTTEMRIQRSIADVTLKDGKRSEIRNTEIRNTDEVVE